MSENENHDKAKIVELDLAIIGDNQYMKMTRGEVENLYELIHNCCDFCGGNLAEPMMAKSGDIDCNRCPVGMVLNATREIVEG